MNLSGRRLHVSGSVSPFNATDVVQCVHSAISEIVHAVLGAGGGLVVGVGREPKAAGADATAPSLTFDWTILEAAAASIRAGKCKWPLSAGPVIVGVASEKGLEEIPTDRQALWNELNGAGQVRLELIMPGARSATLIRERQIIFGDVLLILGGGTGVEHLAELYINAKRPVIPFGFKLGASRGDGTGGAYRLFREARADPQRFFELGSSSMGRETALLSALSGAEVGLTPAQIAVRFLALIDALAFPKIFYVRLLNSGHEKFPAVEGFFRHVVDPIIEEMAFQRIEMGTDDARHGFMNVAIFESLHYSSGAVIDVTGERPNCFIELGYAFGRSLRTIVSAEQGTTLPFDQSAVPCHFWEHGMDDLKRREKLRRFWRKNFYRPPLVL